MTARFLRNVLAKTLLLLVAFNFAVTSLYPFEGLGRITAYHSLFRGRERLPFGENPAEAYNFSLYNLEAMLRSLALDGSPKSPQEYRVLVIGDSSIWGTLLRPQDTLAGQLDQMGLGACDGRSMRFYNLGYPTLSLTKDLMILQMAMRYQPDLIIWSLTLQSLPRDRQLESPIVQNNPQRVQALIERYHLALDSTQLEFPDFWQRSLIGQRRALADWVRLQLYGPMWAATGIDQYYPDEYTPAARDLTADATFNGWSGPRLDEDALSWDVLAAGIKAAGNIPVLLVNEPTLISRGENSDLRYNFYYPRWAFDHYRLLLAEKAEMNGWAYLDLWDLVDEREFTNTAIHLTPDGTAQMARALAESLPCQPAP